MNPAYRKPAQFLECSHRGCAGTAAGGAQKPAAAAAAVGRSCADHPGHLRRAGSTVRQQRRRTGSRVRRRQLADSRRRLQTGAAGASSDACWCSEPAVFPASCVVQGVVPWRLQSLLPARFTCCPLRQSRCHITATGRPCSCSRQCPVAPCACCVRVQTLPREGAETRRAVEAALQQVDEVLARQQEAAVTGAGTVSCTAARVNRQTSCICCCTQRSHLTAARLIVTLLCGSP